MANITIPKMQIGLASRGRWDGDLSSSGILGLGLKGLADATVGELPATGPSPFITLPSVKYDPLVDVAANQTSHLFALSLSRNSSESWLSFGGIPHGVQTTGDWATTKITKVRDRPPSCQEGKDIS